MAETPSAIPQADHRDADTNIKDVIGRRFSTLYK
jgi:hypothetical protein